ncbi:MAG: SDR family oxidoreductase [Bifidobacteriaceae bacterium]|jgi:gluconate 5-dehydrogenase|nr:SDR family oxidoreductase [Bifidobacteriaceae bacterium]
MSVNLFDISGQHAIVTGASSGLGAQFAKALAAQGVKVALFARRLDKLEQLAAEIEEEFGVRALPIKCDVNDTDAVNAAVAEVEDKFGTIEILINNAGVARSVPAEDQSDDDWNAVIDTNLSSVYKMSRAVGKIMKKNGYGRIINLGSIHSKVAMPGMPISGYVASKHGVIGLTKDLAAEWAKDGITVNAIGPAYFESEMTGGFIGSEPFQGVLRAYCPMGRAGKPGELDGAVIYFASKASSFTTGQYLAIDGGWTAI